uniref:D-mandelate dehydrogenase n=2 Tax=Rhodotorula graminis TaxID=29898 RepID=Q7LLW9_RHOGR|nr:Chain A, D-MANDELATE DEHYDROGENASE [Rhodotorula graminis]2W2L_A Chain A, D-MANDELATE DEHYDROGENASE [Rhodotorula graminis]2W2L_B Chain B, D-MANDELATE DEHYDROGENASE [Rhodotorula graminis]2W2L_C Chain C, D-MANDELATE DEHYDROGENASE [Rhodotorula graminis]CAA04756.2 D-mandelate dehydrogenase [Rhodotorula graminis]
MPRPRVLLLGDPARHLDDLWSDFQQKFEVIPANLTTHDGFKQALREKRYGDFEAIIKLAVENGTESYPWNADLISHLPSSLKVFAAAGAGFDWLDLDALNERGVAFANSRGAGDTATSDLALYLILSVFRLASYSERAARTGDPETFNRVHLEIGKSAHNPRGHVLGAVGLGAIQKEIARKAVHGLGMKLVYYDVAPADAETEKALGAERVDSLEELARRSDCVSVSVPYMKLTHHLIDEAFFAAMKPGSRIVNTARGPVISQDALIAALKSGKLLSAGLDVHEFEPQVSKELIEMKHVTLTTHIGGVAIETFHEFERLTMTNIDRFLLQGKPLLTPAGKVFAPSSAA